MTQAAATSGVHHVGLTVPDLNETKTFFVETLGFNEVGGIPDYPSVFVHDGTVMLTLWQLKDTDNQVAFNRRANVGLHHLALKVDGLDNLKALHAKLAAHPAVEIEFAPEPLGDLPIHHMMCFIPGGIRVEFIAPEA